ncbi:unnamed protein product, partial [Dovyalis caffra]
GIESELQDIPITPMTKISPFLEVTLKDSSKEFLAYAEITRALNTIGERLVGGPFIDWKGRILSLECINNVVSEQGGFMFAKDTSGDNVIPTGCVTLPNIAFTQESPDSIT